MEQLEIDWNCSEQVNHSVSWESDLVQMAVAVAAAGMVETVLSQMLMQRMHFLEAQHSTVAAEKTGSADLSDLVEAFAEAAVYEKHVVLAPMPGAAFLHKSVLDMGHFLSHPNLDVTFGGVPSVVAVEGNAEDIHDTAVVAAAAAVVVAAADRAPKNFDPNPPAFVGELPDHLFDANQIFAAAVVVGTAVDCSQDNVENVHSQHSADSVVADDAVV